MYDAPMHRQVIQGQWFDLPVHQKPFGVCPQTRKLCPHLACDPPYDCQMVEAHTARDNVGDWKPYYLWLPRPLGGKWHWRKTIFRRRVWNQFDSWYEYSFLPMDGAPVYSLYAIRSGDNL